MGQSPDCHLFYGYVWDDETSVESILNEEGDEWVEVLLKRRGVTNPWDLYRSSGKEAEHTALPYNNQDSAYEAWKSETGFDALLDEWSLQKKDAKAEFNCEMSSYGALGYGSSTAYIYVKSSPGVVRSYQSDWNGPTRVHSSVLHGADYEQMDAWLQEFINALNLPMGKPDYGDPPAGPGWFMVTSYG